MIVMKLPFAFPRLGWWITALSLVVLAGCSAQAIRDDGLSLINQGRYEEGLKTLQQGAQSYPDSAVLRSALIRAQGEAVTRLLLESRQARAQGDDERTEKSLRRALSIDPGNTRVQSQLQEIERDRRLDGMLADANELMRKGRYERALNMVEQGLKDNPRQADLLALQRRLEMENRQVLGGSTPHLMETKPITLEFRDAPLRMLLDVLSKHSDIGFVLDKDVKPEIRATVFLKQTSIENALELITNTNQLSTKVLSPRSVLIYPNTPDKQKEYQDQIFRVFFLSYANAKDLAALLKSMLKLHEVQIDERLNTLMIRENPDTVRLAERIIALQDLPDPEVMMDVEVMEVSTSNLDNLGIKFPESVGLSILKLDGESSLTVQGLKHFNGARLGLTIPDTTINLQHELGEVNLLANPKIRAKNKEKAKIMVGDKVPIFTSTTTTSGFVSESTQMLDVGIKLEVQPTISLDDEVTLNVSLEVSSLGNQVTSSGGSSAYQIGTRNANTVLRLRDGETQVLGGLISKEERSTTYRLPGLGDFPILGRLFSSKSDNDKKTEIILAITPHILRNLRRPDINQAEFWSGSEKEIRMRPLSLDAASTNTKRTPSNADAANPGQTSNAAPPAEGNAGAQSMPVDATNASGAAPAQPSALPLPGLSSSVNTPPDQGNSTDDAPHPPSLSLQIPASARMQDVLSIPVVFESQEAMRGMSMALGVDGKAFEVLGVEGGPLMQTGGSATSVSFYQDKKNGTLTLGVMRNAPAGVTGKGVAALIKLKPLLKGNFTFKTLTATLIPSQGAAQPLAAMTPLSLQVN